MKKNNKFYIIETFILIFIIMFKIIYNNIPNHYAYLTNIIFWILITIILWITGGFPKDKSYFKKSSTKTVIIILLFYILTIYLLGLFIGFIKNLYFYNIFTMMKKVIPIALFIITSEISRYLFLKHNPNKLQIIIFTIELIILNIIIGINDYNIFDTKQLFIITSIVTIPIIANEIACSYITYNVGLLPTIIYKLIFNLYSYIVPFNPDLSDYLRSILGLIIPYITYQEIKKNLKYREKYSLYAKKTIIKCSTIILSAFLSGLILLTSGIFKYQLIAIATGSMEPVYYRGDAVILEKVNPDTIKVGDILVYKTSGGIVTHRVTEIIEKNGSKVFHTKGDNNATEDNTDISEKDVKGIVKYIVKYAGYPTIMFNDLLESKWFYEKKYKIYNLHMFINYIIYN